MKTLGDFFEELGHWIAVPPRLAKCLGGINPAILVVYFLQWTQSSEDSWVFRTREQIEDETGLSRYEQENARRHLRKKGILLEEYRGIPRRLFYRINKQKLHEVWLEYLETQKSLKPAKNSVGSSVPLKPLIQEAHQQVGTPCEKPESEDTPNRQAGWKTTNKQAGKPPTSRLLFPQLFNRIKKR